MHAFPPPQGLYDGRHEHDACGVAFVATLTGVASHDIVAQAVTALRNLEHRGATGAEPDTGDGAGILLGVPDRFFREVTAELGFELPPARAYAVGTAFLPGDEDQVGKTKARIEEIAAEEGLSVVGWRPVPTDPSMLGATAISVMNASISRRPATEVTPSPASFAMASASTVSSALPVSTTWVSSRLRIARAAAAKSRAG